MAIEGGAEAAVVELWGAVALSRGDGLSRGFHGQAVGFDDGQGVSVGRAVWTDERGDRIYSRLKGEPLATGRRIVGTITGGTGRYAGLEGEYSFTWQYVVAAEDGAIQGRARAPRRPRAPQGDDAVTASAADRKALVARAAVLALALGIWFSPVPGGLVPAAWHLFALFVAAIVAVVIGAFPDPDLLRPRPGRGGPHRDAGAGQGLLRLRQRHDPPDRRRLPRGPRRREVRPRRAPRPPRGERLRAIDARPRLQHLPGRRRDRARLPEQHRPLRRALPARAVGGRGGGREAGRGGPPAPRQLPDVLGHGEPDRLVGPVVHGHGREPARGGDRARLRPGDRLRLLARRVLGADARRDGPAAASSSTRSSSPR